MTLGKWSGESASELGAGARMSIAKGLGELAAWRRSNAIQYLEECIKLYPSEAAVWMSYGYCFEYEDWEKALGSYRRAEELTPSVAEIHNEIGLAYWFLRRTDESIKEYVTAAKLAPASPDPYFGLANVYFCSEQYADAAKASEEAVRIAPDEPTAHFNLGLSYSKLGRPADADRQFAEYIRLFKDKGYARQQVGLAYRDARRYDDSLRELKLALRMQKDDWNRSSDYLALGWVYEKIHRYAAAAKAYRNASNLSPRAALNHDDLGRVYYKMGRYRDSIAENETAIKNDTGWMPDARLRIYIGMAYEKLGLHDESTSAFAQGLQIDPDFARKDLEYGLYDLKKGDVDAAMDELELLKALDKEKAAELDKAIAARKSTR